MRVEYVRTYLEMTDPADLRPAAPSPTVSIQSIDGRAPLLRDVVTRVGAPHHWPGLHASPQEWDRTVSLPALEHWLVTVDGEPGGVAALQAQPSGDVELVSFGLVPSLVGHGHGGAALTDTVRLAWGRAPVDDEPIRRVWLHTSSLDHPNALHNYRRRGFRIVRTEPRSKEVPER